MKRSHFEGLIKQTKSATISGPFIFTPVIPKKNKPRKKALQRAYVELLKFNLKKEMLRHISWDIGRSDFDDLQKQISNAAYFATLKYGHLISKTGHKWIDEIVSHVRLEGDMIVIENITFKFIK